MISQSTLTTMKIPFIFPPCFRFLEPLYLVDCILSFPIPSHRHPLGTILHQTLLDTFPQGRLFPHLQFGWIVARRWVLSSNGLQGQCLQTIHLHSALERHIHFHSLCPTLLRCLLLSTVLCYRVVPLVIYMLQIKLLLVVKVFVVLVLFPLVVHRIIFFCFHVN